MNVMIWKLGAVLGLAFVLGACAPQGYQRGDYSGNAPTDYGAMSTSPTGGGGSGGMFRGLSMGSNCMCNAPRRTMSVQSASTIGPGTVFTLEDVLFEFDRAKLLPRGWQVVREVAGHLHNNSSYRVLVEGHTDSRGSQSYNMRLSRARAESVQNALASLGISPTRVGIAYYGERRPIASNATASGRRLNRRVHIILQ